MRAKRDSVESRFRRQARVPVQVVTPHCVRAASREPACSRQGEGRGEGVLRYVVSDVLRVLSKRQGNTAVLMPKTEATQSSAPVHTAAVQTQDMRGRRASAVQVPR